MSCTSAKASTCGRWLTAASTLSCSSGFIFAIRAPHDSHARSTLPTAGADDVRCDLRLLQRQGKAAADETDADDGKLHSFRLAASAARNLSFSCGVPMVTRRCSGSP